MGLELDTIFVMTMILRLFLHACILTGFGSILAKFHRNILVEF
jgi:hypothetical protein